MGRVRQWGELGNGESQPICRLFNTDSKEIRRVRQWGE